ncbi:MAG: class I SAM-dependent methyltransferase [Nanoarchaeota archaeon]
MKSNEYSVMYELEESHWWFKGKRKIIFSQVDKHLKNKNPRILDIGCGTGIMMKNFEKYGKVFGLDIHFPALEFCSARDLHNLVQGDIGYLPFKSGSFNVVGIYDVLYHKAVKSDVNALREIYRILKKGGLLVITDSADMGLWSRHDIAAHARERYTVALFSKRLKSTGYGIRKITYFNTFLYPLVYAFRKVDNLINKNKPTKSNIEKTNAIINFILYSIFVLESFLIKFLNMPFGVSIFVIAEKQR